MRDEGEEMDGTFRWASECRDRYEITLLASDGNRFLIPKYVMKTICTYMEIAKMAPYDYIFSKPKELRDVLSYSNFDLDRLVDVRIVDTNEQMDRNMQRFVDKSVEKYMKRNVPKNRGTQKPPESKGHALIKTEIVEFLNGINIESYPEVVFYNGRVLKDFYEWQRAERKSKGNVDGIFGYGNVGYGNYKQDYGRQIKVDVAGWVDEKYKFQYPIVAVEVMKSSNLREEINNLQEIHGVSSVFTVVVDAFGELNGTINNTPVVSVDNFKKGIMKRLELVKEALKAGKSESEIFEIGQSLNVGKIE